MQMANYHRGIREALLVLPEDLRRLIVADLAHSTTIDYPIQDKFYQLRLKKTNFLLEHGLFEDRPDIKLCLITTKGRDVAEEISKDVRFSTKDIVTWGCYKCVVCGANAPKGINMRYNNPVLSHKTDSEMSVCINCLFEKFEFEPKEK